MTKTIGENFNENQWIAKRVLISKMYFCSEYSIEALRDKIKSLQIAMKWKRADNIGLERKKEKTTG